MRIWVIRLYCGLSVLVCLFYQRSLVRADQPRSCVGWNNSTQESYCHSERSEESGGSRTVLQSGTSAGKATSVLQFLFILTHLIPHCVRNDKTGLWVLLLGTAYGPAIHTAGRCSHHSCGANSQFEIPNSNFQIVLTALLACDILAAPCFPSQRPPPAIRSHWVMFACWTCRGCWRGLIAR